MRIPVGYGCALGLYGNSKGKTGSIRPRASRTRGWDVSDGALHNDSAAARIDTRGRAKASCSEAGIGRSISPGDEVASEQVRVGLARWANPD
jgi:hypothetical protein